MDVTSSAMGPDLPNAHRRRVPGGPELGVVVTLSRAAARRSQGFILAQRRAARTALAQGLVEVEQE